MYDLLIRNGLLYDGTGAAPYTADLAVENGYIARIGAIGNMEAKRVIDACGHPVTPGFIDMHSHADLSIVQYGDAENLLGQGVTTAFTGHCGMGMAPVGEWWKTQNDDIFALEDFMPLSSIGSIPGRTPVCRSEQLRPAYEKYFGVAMDWTTFGDYREKLRRQGVGINLIMEVGLQQIRQAVLGPDSDRPATEREICEMEKLVEEAMEAGAWGLSIGYDYTPDLSASQEELDRLALIVKKYDGIVAAHTRNGKDDDLSWQPVDGYREFMDMGLRTGVRMHISHVQPGYSVTPIDRAMFSQSALRTLALFEEYRAKGLRLTWDVLHPEAMAFYYYPELCSAMKHYILACGGKTAFRAKLEEPEYFNWLISQVSRRKHILFPRFETNRKIVRCTNDSYIGRTPAEMATDAGISEIEMALRILREDINTCIRPTAAWERTADADGPIDTFIEFWKRDDACIGTDNITMNYDYEGHGPELPAFRATPMAYGGIVHFLERSHEEGITFEKTVRKLTGCAADSLGLSDRGYLHEGMRADITVLNPDTLCANLGYLDPRQRPSGIDYVVVNGVLAVDNGRHTHARSGMLPNLH